MSENFKDSKANMKNELPNKTMSENLEDSKANVKNEVLTTMSENCEDSKANVKNEVPFITMSENVEDSKANVKNEVLTTMSENCEDSKANVKNEVPFITMSENVEDSKENVKKEVSDNQTMSENVEDSKANLKQEVYNETMSENLEDSIADVENEVEIFANLGILKDIENIVNVVSIEDFLEAVPKCKQFRVKWTPMYNCLKREMYDEMLHELELMWEDENMPTKLEHLEKQKEKFSGNNEDQKLWRPQLGDVKAQLRASDVANLRKQKVSLEHLVNKYEANMDSLKKTVTAKRAYLQALQWNIQKYEKKNEELLPKLGEKLANHGNMMPIKTDVNDLPWTEKELD